MEQPYRLIQGDCIEKMRELPDNSVDSIVTDPPYELGFMGKSWDASGIAYNVEMWKEALRVLKPGGHLLAFSGSRTYHRMTCAIEDAGFEVRDQIMWVYGSGFPKSLNVGKALDKSAGVEREVIGTSPNWRESKRNREENGSMEVRGENAGLLTKPATEAAKQWDGWGTALKPAHEPICVARKPLEGTVAENVMKWGTGAINVDACRVKMSDKDKELARVPNKNLLNGIVKAGRDGVERNGTVFEPADAGRWPANLIHDGSQEVLDLFPESNGGAAPKKTNGVKTLFDGGWKGVENEERVEFGSGSAARFFYCPKANKKDRDDGCEEMEERRESDREKDDGVGGDNPRNRTNNPRKNHHPTVKPTDLMRYLCKLITPPLGTILDPFNGSGSTGRAAMLEGFKYIGIEREEEYIKIADARIKATLNK